MSLPYAGSLFAALSILTGMIAIVYDYFFHRKKE